MVAAPAPHPLVEQDLAAGRGSTILVSARFCCSEKFTCAGCERHSSPRTCTPRPREVGEHVHELGARAGEPLVGVTLPVGEVHPVVGARATQSTSYRRPKYVGAVDEHLDPVARAPAGALAPRSMRVHAVAAFVRGQEPVLDAPHGDDLPERR